jgi:hypothetical protein
VVVEVGRLVLAAEVDPHLLRAPVSTTVSVPVPMSVRRGTGRRA